MNKLRTLLVSGYLVILGMMVFLGVSSYTNINSIVETESLVSDSHEIISDIRLIEKSLVDMETGQRGFLITGNEEFLEPYDNSISDYEQLITALRYLEQNSPMQLNRLDLIDRLVDEWHVTSGDPEIFMRRSISADSINALAIEQMLVSGAGKNILDQMRVIMDEMVLAFRADGNTRAELLTLVIAKAMVDQETGQRGFLITGDESFLEPYEAGFTELVSALEEIRSLVSQAHDRDQLDLMLEQSTLLQQQWETLVMQTGISQRLQFDLGNISTEQLESSINQVEQYALMGELKSTLAGGIDVYADSENQNGITLILTLQNYLDVLETNRLVFIQSGNEAAYGDFISAGLLYRETTASLKFFNDNAYDIETANSQIDQLEVLAMGWSNQAAAPEIATRRAMDQQAISIEGIAARIESGIGKAIFDELRAAISEFIDAEEILLQQRSQASLETANQTIGFSVIGTLLAILAGLAAGLFTLRKVLSAVGGEPIEIAEITQQVALGKTDLHKINDSPTGILASIYSLMDTLQQRASHANRIAEGQFDIDQAILSDDDTLGKSLINMAQKLKQASQNEAEQKWHRTGELGLASEMSNAQDVIILADSIVAYLAKFLNMQLGTLYLLSERDENCLMLCGGYALSGENQKRQKIRLGEGITGQAAVDRETILITSVPDDYFRIDSTLGSTLPSNILATALVHEDKLLGVMEFASVKAISETEKIFLHDLLPSITAALTSAIDRLAIRSNEERMHALINTAVDAIISIDEDGVILNVNQATVSMFGYSEEELIGNNIDSLMASPYKEDHQEYLRNFKTTGVKNVIDSQREFEAAHKDGSIIPIILSVGEAHHQGRKVFNGFIRDITEQKQADKALAEQNASLKQQQKVLSKANVELEEHQSQIELQNIELIDARQGLQARAEELQQASKYKSEFLANMSHELRTPLNSLLILSQLLTEDSEGNLTDKQLESINTIHNSGDDLLNLINNILDLAKIESGKVEIVVENVALKDFTRRMELQFKHQCNEKSLNYEAILESDLPEIIKTDEQRLGQIIKNLLSNAIKFTPQGKVSFRIFKPENSEFAIGFSVTDSGIGIAEDKQESVFEAFTQADGTTSRKFGGTGLGLSISREMSKTLGGEIKLESEEGIGSCFTLYLQLSPADENTPTEKAIDFSTDTDQDIQTAVQESTELDIESSQASEFSDDRGALGDADNVILIVEDDISVANVLTQLAQKRGFKCIVTDHGETAVQYAQEYKPKAIILDIHLSGMDGWGVMNQLKDHKNTRHIPVHFVTGSDEPWYAMRLGAAGYMTKPLTLESIDETYSRIEKILGKSVKGMLIVVKDQRKGKEVVDTTGDGDIHFTIATSGKDALKELQSGKYECVVIAPEPDDMTAIELLRKVEQDDTARQVPAIIYTQAELSPNDERALEHLSATMTVHAVRSPERLLDETILFLHRIESELPESQRELLEMVHDKESILKGKKVLLTDDDMRNVYALNAALQNKGMEVLTACNGIEAISQLQQNPDIDLVLMDIMMPEMDGYEAMREIRKDKRFERLPIVALTAKALKEDRQKCLSAGASDYLTKPVDLKKLTSILRVWLYN